MSANTIELTLLQAGAFPEDSLLLTVWDDGAVAGAALQTPPYPLACNAIPCKSMNAVAAELVAARPGLAGVRGERSSAVAFADAWQAISLLEFFEGERRIGLRVLLAPRDAWIGVPRA